MNSEGLSAQALQMALVRCQAFILEPGVLIASLCFLGGTLLVGGIDAGQNLIEMASQCVIAAARQGLQLAQIADLNPAAARLQQVSALQGLNDAAHVASADAHHAGQLLLRQWNIVISGPINSGQQPFHRSLLDRMNGIARHRLENLRQHAIRITSEEMAQARRPNFELLEICSGKPEEWTWKLDLGTGKSRKSTLAYDPADRPLASDQGRLDRETILELKPRMKPDWGRRGSKQT